MNTDVGSIMAACSEHHPVVVYTDRMPQDFEVPSMYFPQPIVVGGGDSLSSYKQDCSLAVNFFDKTSEKASDAAEYVAHCIYARRLLIPKFNNSGVRTGWMRLRRIESQVIEDGVALLTFVWTTRYQFIKVDYEKMKKWEGIKWQITL